MSLLTSQILKFVDLTKTKESRYLENDTFFFSNKKINYTSRATLWQNSFVAGVTFNKAAIKNDMRLVIN